MTDFNPLAMLKLSIQMALLDEVTDNLYAVTCGIERQSWIRIVAYFDGPANEEEVETISCVGTEVIASFPDGFRIEETCLDATQTEPVCLDFWAFRRKRKPGHTSAERNRQKALP